MYRLKYYLTITSLIISLFYTNTLFCHASTGKSTSKPGYVLVKESTLDVFIGDIEKQFQIAHRYFNDDDKKGAALVLRKAAGFMKLELSRSAGESKKHLLAAIQDIERIAVSVEKGTLRSARILERLFANTTHALAEHYNELAKQNQGIKEIKQTGRFLKAAAAHLERGTYWVGSELKKTGTQSVEHTKQLGDKFIKGVDTTFNELGKSIENLGKEIEKLGQKIGTKK